MLPFAINCRDTAILYEFQARLRHDIAIYTLEPNQMTFAM